MIAPFTIIYQRISNPLKGRTLVSSFRYLYVQSDGHRCSVSIASSAALPTKEDFCYAPGKERFFNCSLHRRRLLRSRLPQLEDQDRLLLLDYLLALARRNCVAATLAGAISASAAFLKTVNGRPLLAITHRDIEQFIEHQQDRGLLARH